MSKKLRTSPNRPLENSLGCLHWRECVTDLNESIVPQKEALNNRGTKNRSPQFFRTENMKRSIKLKEVARKTFNFDNQDRRDSRNSNFENKIQRRLDIAQKRRISRHIKSRESHLHTCVEESQGKGGSSTQLQKNPGHQCSAPGHNIQMQNKNKEHPVLNLNCSSTENSGRKNLDKQSVSLIEDSVKLNSRTVTNEKMSEKTKHHSRNSSDMCSISRSSHLNPERNRANFFELEKIIEDKMNQQLNASNKKREESSRLLKGPDSIVDQGHNGDMIFSVYKVQQEEADESRVSLKQQRISALLQKSKTICSKIESSMRSKAEKKRQKLYSSSIQQSKTSLRLEENQACNSIHSVQIVAEESPEVSPNTRMLRQMKMSLDTMNIRSQVSIANSIGTIKESDESVVLLNFAQLSNESRNRLFLFGLESQ